MSRKEYLPFGKPNFSDEEIAAVTRVLRSGWVGMGPETIAFEQELGEYVGAPHLVTVNSCTSALFLSLLVSGVGAGDEVICPSLTWCSTANAALYLGAKPIFCDIDSETLCVRSEDILAKITARTKAVMVVHFGGLAVDVEELRAALPRGISIIEDAAHALGANYPNGQPVGSSGNLTCFSFYANKNLSSGEGGAIALFDGSLAERLQSLRQHGLPVDAWKRFSHPQSILSGELRELGYKMNYTDLQACIARVQLRQQAEFHKRRLAIAKRYFAGAQRMGIRCQKSCTDIGHARHLFIVMLPLEKMRLSRDDLFLRLRGQNIGVSIHYPPLHKMSLYSKFCDLAVLPNTEAISPRIITLPISASMELNDAEQVLAAIEKELT